LNNNEVVGMNGGPYPTLIHIGLAYNKVSDEKFIDLLNECPNLFSINISHNLLTNLASFIETLKS